MIKGVRAIVISSAILIAFYGMFLLIYGIPGISFPESLEPEILPQGGTLKFSPAFPQGLILLGCALTIIVGLLMRKPAISWLGVTVLFIFSVLFLHSIGSGLFPLIILLSLLLGVITFSCKLHNK